MAPTKTTTPPHLHVIEEDPIKDFHLDYHMLQRVIRWNCEHNPRFKGTTAKDRAKMCGISESTYNTIVNGKNTKPRIDILYAIVASFDGYIDPLVGLAPERDLDKEKEHYDGTFMESMQWQLDKARADLAEKREEANGLRVELAEYKTECKALQRELADETEHRRERAKMVEVLRKDLREYRIFVGVAAILIILAFLFIFYLIFIDFPNSSRGIFQY